MSNDPERGADDGVPDQPEKTTDTKQRDGVGQFANYTAPATLAMLVSTKAASAS